MEAWYGVGQRGQSSGGKCSCQGDTAALGSWQAQSPWCCRKLNTKFLQYHVLKCRALTKCTFIFTHAKSSVGALIGRQPSLQWKLGHSGSFHLCSATSQSQTTRSRQNGKERRVRHVGVLMSSAQKRDTCFCSCYTGHLDGPGAGNAVQMGVQE